MKYARPSDPFAQIDIAWQLNPIFFTWQRTVYGKLFERKKRRACFDQFNSGFHGSLNTQADIFKYIIFSLLFVRKTKWDCIKISDKIFGKYQCMHYPRLKIGEANHHTEKDELVRSNISGSASRNSLKNPTVATSLCQSELWRNCSTLNWVKSTESVILITISFTAQNSQVSPGIHRDFYNTLFV